MVPTGKKVDGKIERHPVWMCADRVKGKEGNGCKSRNVNEEELLKAFGPGVEQVKVIENGFIKTKTGG